jgi:hypothetical protein
MKKVFVGCGIRTHAQLTESGLKSDALTTRPTRLVAVMVHSFYLTKILSGVCINLMVRLKRYPLSYLSGAHQAAAHGRSLQRDYCQCLPMGKTPNIPREQTY